ncbi:MAG: NUDIX domain-containing protein [Nanoarchaeota archaeon]|nr:NUDIX domain-containing protein [Nanoarchaeota archaeon]
MEKRSPRLTSAVLVENDGKFLLAQRNKENARGCWVIPGGGVDFGETLKDAAVREIKEETNLDVEIVKLIGHKEVVFPMHDYHTVIFFYLGKPKHLNIKASDDVSDARFFSIEEIKNLKLVPSVEWVLRDIGVWKE